MKFLKKCIRKLYHLIYFLSILIIFSPRVYAIEENTNIGDTNFYTPPYATFGDVTNDYVTRYEGTSSHNVYYAPSNLVTTGGNTDGMAVAFSHESLFIKDYYYNVTLLVGFSSDSAYPKATSNRVCLNHNLTQVINSYNSNTNCTTATVYTWDNVSPFTTYDGTQLYLGMISYIFTSPVTTKSFIGIVNSSVRKVGYQIFGGVYVEQLADNKTSSSLSAQDMHNILNNSGLASASSVQEVQESIQEVKEELSSIDDTINNNNVDGANSQVDSLLNNSNFNDTSGIQSIINAPLNFINSLSNTCSPINLTIPYIDEPVQIPCIKQELNTHIPLVVPVLSTAINGFIIYRILLDIVRIIKNARNPDDDRIEVLDL